jgi:hypothetical protein
MTRWFDDVVSSAWIPSAERRGSGHALGPIVVALARR